MVVFLFLVKTIRHYACDDSPLMGVWPPLVGVVGVAARGVVKGREDTAGYDNKIPASEKYLSTNNSKWSPFRKLQEINLVAAGVKST
jgi:hypothetical protein